MSSQYQNPYISPVVNQKPPLKARRTRQKSLPPLPISMWTQDKMHASLMALHAVVPPFMTIACSIMVLCNSNRQLIPEGIESLSGRVAEVQTLHDSLEA
jgi:hypothetical protein